MYLHHTVEYDPFIKRQVAWQPATLNTCGISCNARHPYIQGFLAHKKHSTPWDHHRALGIGLLQGPTGGKVLMSEVHLYFGLREMSRGQTKNLLVSFLSFQQPQRQRVIATPHERTKCVIVIPSLCFCMSNTLSLSQVSERGFLVEARSLKTDDMGKRFESLHPFLLRASEG